MEPVKIVVKADNEDIDVIVNELIINENGDTIDIDYTVDDRYNKSMVEKAVGNFVITALENFINSDIGV